jgi:hypothetical protein
VIKTPSFLNFSTFRKSTMKSTPHHTTPHHTTKLAQRLRNFAFAIPLLIIASCGGGGGDNATTPNYGTGPAAATAIPAIQAQLTIWQNKFATSTPAANDAALAAIFDPAYLNDGENKALYLAYLTGPNRDPIGYTFSAPTGVDPVDLGAMPNDATHQWFTTKIWGISDISYLAVKDAAGQWLLSGNQRKVGVEMLPSVSQLIPTAASGQSAIIQPRVSLSIFNSAGVTAATVSGPGVIGTTAGVLGSADLLFSSTAQECSLITTTSCLDMSKVSKGNYTFTITDAAGTYTYIETLKAVPPLNPTAAMLPTINWITPVPTNLAAWVSGATATVNWTVPAGQTAILAEVDGSDASFASLFQVPMYAINSTGTISSVKTLPAYTGSVAHISTIAFSMDTNGTLFYTAQSY